MSKPMTTVRFNSSLAPFRQAVSQEDGRLNEPNMPAHYRKAATSRNGEVVATALVLLYGLNA